MPDSATPLGEFLRARRHLLDPSALNLPDHGRRRQPGLRREELALLAGVSSHYYARLEQGTARNPSPAVLDALAGVLGLNAEATAHLYRLAQPAYSAPARTRARKPETARASLVELIKGWSEQPAVIIGRHRDVLAANDLAVALNAQFTPGRNLLREVFLDLAAHDIYPDWEEVALGAVAGVRASAGTDMDDPRLTQLVGELALKSAQFRAMWARHDVRERTSGAKRFHNPVVGSITLRYESLADTGAPGQTLMIFTAEADSTHEQSLRLLATALPVAADGPRPARPGHALANPTE
ncbi:helix-turn-helix domain-containing protein [Streptomyces sp. SCPE 10]|uniref:helix-turn-helix domain-containing protein n=1 Tax=Streptomyces sp. SCPE 10 TaxID=3449273 RepID=UPI003F7E0FA3